MPRSALRESSLAFDYMPFAYAVGGIAALVNARGQRLGDLVAGTLVIHEPTEHAPDDAVLAGLRYNSLREQAALVARRWRGASQPE